MTVLSILGILILILWPLLSVLWYLVSVPLANLKGYVEGERWGDQGCNGWAGSVGVECMVRLLKVAVPLLCTLPA